MSLPAKDVFDRILSQISQQPRLPIEILPFDGEGLFEPGWNAALAVARCDSASRSAIPSNLHFWAAGLEAFMARRGNASRFVETAICGLCTPIDSREWQTSVDAILGLVRNPPALTIDSDALGVYRMFDDGNRRSIMIEFRNRYAAIYWENDTAPPASYPLLKALYRKAAEVSGRAAGQHWSAAQHHSRLSDLSDVVYGWRVANGEVEPIDRGALADDVQLRFTFSSESGRVAFAWGADAESVCRASYWVRGEEAAIRLLNDDEVDREVATREDRVSVGVAGG